MPAERAAPPSDHRLITTRTVIRAYRPADAEALYQTVTASREHIAQWLPWTPTHTSVEASRQMIDQFAAEWEQGKAFTYGVFAREASGVSGALLGGLGLHPRERDVPSFEIGYWLAAEAEGQGYTTEAAAALVDYVLHDLGARRIQILCNALNTRSAAVARRLGFEQEGLLRHHRRAHDGSLRDTLIFARVV